MHGQLLLIPLSFQMDTICEDSFIDLKDDKDLCDVDEEDYKVGVRSDRDSSDEENDKVDIISDRA